MALINGTGMLTASGFDWQVAFPCPVRGSVSLSENLNAGAAADLKTA